jgi:hypothetical protein
MTRFEIEEGLSCYGRRRWAVIQIDADTGSWHTILAELTRQEAEEAKDELTAEQEVQP